MRSMIGIDYYPLQLFYLFWIYLILSINFTIDFCFCSSLIDLFAKPLGGTDGRASIYGLRELRKTLLCLFFF